MEDDPKIFCRNVHSNFNVKNLSILEMFNASLVCGETHNFYRSHRFAQIWRIICFVKKVFNLYFGGQEINLRLLVVSIEGYRAEWACIGIIFLSKYVDRLPEMYGIRYGRFLQCMGVKYDFLSCQCYKMPMAKLGDTRLEIYFMEIFFKISFGKKIM